MILEILDHARLNQPGQAFYKVLAERALRAANKRFVTFIQNIETAATDKNIDLFSADSKTRKILKSEIENQTLKEL